ncbi:IclR family transcriptional regulator [Hansschlegelia sp. KR7-227]|uniref:IclR family transcriptional regulator n=1 Tax=Hansschlegelia sp. KR7-227 TaxID=3400914 RepID=UPI003BFCCD42
MLDDIDHAQATPPLTSPLKPPTIQSVERALTLLELIAESNQDVGLNELAVQARLNASTCHHLLATLVQRGYVAKAPGRRYRPGSRMLSLGQASLKHVDLSQRAAPYLERINAATGETVHLAVLQSGELTTIAKRDARHAVRVDAGNLGKSDAAHATATGKAILAALPESEMRRIVEHRGLRAFTNGTITTFEALAAELETVRRDGFAMDREEFQPFVVCVGAPIRDFTGAVVGSISASTPTMRATEDHLALMRAEVIGATRQLSEELGYSAA